MTSSERRRPAGGASLAGGLYVQYGCGFSAPAGWRNFDSSPTLRLQRLPLVGRFMRRPGIQPFPEGVEYGDIVRGLPIPGGACRGVYCSHVLEHLSLDDFRKALRNTYAVLAPGGIFRLVLPDLELLARRYVESSAPDAASVFMERAYLGTKSRPRGLSGLVIQWLGNAAHLWMWDEKSMTVELEAAGFAQIRRAQFGDSADRRFDEVEDRSRWEDCLGMECVRPGGSAP